MSSFLQKNDHDLLVWAENFAKCLKTYATPLKLEPQKVKDFEALTAKFRNALEKAAAPNHTRMDIKIRVETRAELRKGITLIVMGDVSYNPGLTPEMRHDMLLGERKAPVKVQKPMTSPHFVFAFGRGRVSVRSYDGGSRARPKGVRVTLYKWVLLDRPPVSIEELVQVNSVSSGPFDLVFKEIERGKALYIAACWENTRGETGPWSAIEKVYIP